jgi:hypothetical protein
VCIVTDDIFAKTLRKGYEALDEQTKADLEDMDIPTEPLSAVEAGFFDLPDVCFFCGKRFAGLPAIVWEGHHPDHGQGGRQLWLHVECAKALCLRLMRDWNELKTGKATADRLFRQTRSEHQAEQNEF